MRIIQTTSSLAPEFGGTARCVPAMSVELAKLGNRVTVLALDFDGSATQQLLPSHPNLDYVTLRVFLKFGLRAIWIPGYRKTLLDLVSSDEELLIHDNGIWLPYSGIIQGIANSRAIPRVTTIHGMLEPWSLNFGKWRKKAAWFLYQKKRLESNAVLHATSLAEAENLRALGLSNPVAFLPNGSELPDLTSVKDLPTTKKKTLLFISRIHPKKGLLSLVRAIEILKPNHWEVVVGGYDEDSYWEIIKKAITDAGVDSWFRYIGPVTDKDKWRWYKQADLFVLPSYSENFGLVVAEALAAATPVITTQGTPWKDLVDYNCGWWVKPELQDLVESLREAFGEDDSILRQMGKNGRILIKEKYSWPAIAARMNSVYQWVLQRGPQPPEIIS